MNTDRSFYTAYYMCTRCGSAHPSGASASYCCNAGARALLRCKTCERTLDDPRCAHREAHKRHAISFREGGKNHA